jgi:prevent-host-death family protein
MATVPLSQAKTHLARLLSDAENLGEHVVITRSGRPAGVLVPVDEYEGLVETLDVLADPELSQAIRQGLADIEDGDLVSHEALWNELDHPLRG